MTNSPVLRHLVGSCFAGLFLTLGLALGATPAAAQTASISGTISDAANAGIAGVQVQLTNLAGGIVKTSGANTYSDGIYTITGLNAGTYYLKTYNAGPYINKQYNNISCVGFCNATSGTQLVLTGAQALTVNFTLASGGVINGKLTDAGSSGPIVGANVEVYNTSGSQLTSSGPSDGSGNYSIPALLPGTYLLKTRNTSGYLNKLHSNIACPGFCNVTAGTPLTISAGSTTAVDFALVLGAKISGTVANAANAPLAGVTVQVYSNNSFIASTPTDSSGNYTVAGLPTGSYNVKTQNSLALGYIDQLYASPSVPCLSCTTTAGAAVSVTAPNTTPSINFVLPRGGIISGTVKSTANVLASNVSVQISDTLNPNLPIAYPSTNASGVYTSSGLPAGTYFVRTSYNNLGLINQLFDNINCLSCDVTGGTPLTVTTPASVTAAALVATANFQLPPGGEITGTVTNGTTLLSGISVSLYNSSGGIVTSSSTDSAGVFTLRGLATGSYYVRTGNAGTQNFIDQVYALPANQTCSNCNVTLLGSLVAVVAGSPTSGINFPLVAGGGITGVITNAATTLALSGLNVQVLNSTGAFVMSTNTNASGVYTFGGLPTGNYYLKTSNYTGFIAVIFDGTATGATCLNCLVSTGTPIAVTAGVTASGKNMALTLGKTVTGTVTSTATGTPVVSGVSVSLYSSTNSYAGGSSSNSSGVYTVSGLPAGTYYARTYNGLGFIDQLYNAVVCSNCSNTAGAPIDLTTATSFTANFSLTLGGRVSGTVTSAATTLPLSGVQVNLYAANGNWMTWGSTNDTGRFTTSNGLPAGTYYAQAGGSGFINQLYNAIQCNSSCAPVSGNPIAVTAGQITTGINFAMASGGTVTGSITDNSVTTGPAGIENVSVTIYDSVTGSYIGSGPSSASGLFSVRGLPSGTYVARTNNSVGFIDELYDNLKCASCSASTGKSFTVTAGATTAGINFGLDRGGRITGTVTAFTGGAVLANVNVGVYDSLNRWVTGTQSNQNGVYTTSGMAPGTYFVRTIYNSGGFINQLYENAPCVSCNAAAGKPVVVAGTATTSGISFALMAGGSVTGRVTDTATPTPVGLASISINIYDANNAYVGGTQTTSNGTFTVAGVPTGTYFARTYNSSGYVDRLYDGITCTSCSVTGGTPFSVTVGSTRTGINFALTQGGVITGTVTDAGNLNAPVGGVGIQVFSANGQFIQGTNTGASGVYRTNGGLPAGTYFVRTSNSLGYVDKLYNNTTCLGCNVTSGAPVAVAGTATTSGIDFSLVTGGVVSGSVTSRTSGLPLERISIMVYTSAGFFVTSGYTNGTGTYKTGGMPAGNYFVRTSNSLSFIDQLYNAKDCTNCNPTTGVPVAVTTGSNTTGINFSLAGGGRVRGTVTADGGAAAAGVSVQFFSPAGAYVTGGFTDSQGNYVTYGGMPGGTYYARTSNSSGLIDKVYDNISCNGCSVATGKPIVVITGADTTAINFALALGGRLAGIVTDTASTPLPITNARISVYSLTGAFMASATTGNSGNYLTDSGLPTGSYYLKVSAPGGLISALYKVQTSPPNNINCPSCSPLTGTAVAVTSGSTTPAINFALSLGGVITGTVTADGSGVPLVGVGVRIFDGNNGFVASAGTDAAGRYSSGSGMPSGTYYAQTSNNQGYVNKVFDNTACLNCLPNTGAPITVTAGATRSGVDFSLVAGGRVAGTVTDVATGLPLANAQVAIFSSNGKGITGGMTDNAGAFTTFGGLPTGTYFARASAMDQGYVPQVFNNTVCLGCNVTRGTPVGVTSGATTGSINFALAVGGGFSGRVTSTESSAGLGNVEVSLFTGQGTFVGSGRANADGTFGASGIPAGSYLMRTTNLQGFVDEAFDNVACAPCPMTPTTATAITVTARSTTSNINFGLDTGGLVSGILTDSATGAPVAGGSVSFLQNGVFRGRSKPTDENGFYAISLPVGTYTVLPDAAQGFSFAVTAGSRTAAGTTVTVSRGGETSGVSFPLSACTPPTVLPATLAILTAGQPYSQTFTASGGTGPYSFSVSSGALASGLTLNAATGVVSGTPTVSGTASFSIAAADAAGCSGTTDYTPFVCGVNVGTSQASFTSAAGAGTVALAANATDCAWTATTNASWITLGGTSGTGSATLSYSVAANPSSTVFRTGTMTVAGNAVTVTQGAAVTAAPFGVFDTPTGVATVSGSIAVTGWALDDLGIDRVEIWRDRVAGETTPVYAGAGPGNGKIYIANPLFVSGARSDVAAAYASYPFANRAGWGYLMLTQGLWSQGNGTYTLYAFAYDQEGKSTTLGTKTITVDNANAVKPFGSIDTPTYGQSVSGSFWNFGWALTPNATPTCTITNGNVSMAIDSGTLTPVNYGDTRADIFAAFPGFSNGAGAGGAIYIDTTTLTNGAHQIGWYVVDNCSRAEGVGSRFFTVANATSGVVAEDTGTTMIEAGLTAPVEGITASRAAVSVMPDVVTVQTDGGEALPVTADANGWRVVSVAQGSRVAVQLPTERGQTYTAYQLANGERVALPIGSSFEAAAGTFNWEPGAGFLGNFDLVFVTVDGAAIPVRVVVAEPRRVAAR